MNPLNSPGSSRTERIYSYVLTTNLRYQVFKQDSVFLESTRVAPRSAQGLSSLFSVHEKEMVSLF